MDSGNESDNEPMSTEMSEDISGGSKFHLSVNWREARYKIYYHIKRIQTECKKALIYTQNMGKGLHKVFKAFINDISQVLPIWGKTGSEVSYFIPDPRNIA